MSQMLKVSDLKPHKKNSVFFDDIEGDAWSEFLESIRTSGVIEPIIVTQNNVIVSGHQRVRACKMLKIEELPAEIREYDSEDEILKQLIEANIRQRGIGNANPVKFGRCLMELERIYGVQQGKRTDLETFPNNSEKSQNDLASELGISVDTLNNYKKLANAIPEVQDLVESGRVTKTVALGMMKRLSEDEQRELVSMLPEGAELSSHQVKFYENRIKVLDESNEELKTRVEALENEKRGLEEQLDEMEDAGQETADVVTEDYEKLKEKVGDLELEIEELTESKVPFSNYVSYFSTLFSNFTESIAEVSFLNDRLEHMTDADFRDYAEVVIALQVWMSDYTKAVAEEKKRREALK